MIDLEREEQKLRDIKSFVLFMLGLAFIALILIQMRSKETVSTKKKVYSHQVQFEINKPEVENVIVLPSSAFKILPKA